MPQGVRVQVPARALPKIMPSDNKASSKILDRFLRSPTAQQNGRAKQNRFLQYGIYFFILWYLLLCVVNYFNQRPLWNDEECVFLSVKSFTPKQMFTQGLSSLQVFPRVYLFLTQQFSRFFDFHVLSLRFPSFACMILAFFIWLRLAQYELKEKGKYLIFVLSWCASSMLIYYSSELKQYSMDVLTAALYLLFIYNEEKIKENKNLYAAIVMGLPFLGLLSYTAFFFCPIIIYNFFILSKTDKTSAKSVTVFMASLFAALTISYLFDMRLRPLGILNREWRDYFVSVDSIGEFFKTFGEGTMNLFARWLVEQPRFIKRIGTFFMIFGILNLVYGFFLHGKKEPRLIKSLNTIAFILFLELFAAGIFKKYPFTVPRTSLFYCPIVLYITLQGIGSLKKFNKYVYMMVQGCYVIFLLFLTIALSRLIFSGHSVFAPII